MKNDNEANQKFAREEAVRQELNGNVSGMNWLTPSKVDDPELSEGRNKLERNSFSLRYLKTWQQPDLIFNIVEQALDQFAADKSLVDKDAATLEKIPLVCKVHALPGGHEHLTTIYLSTNIDKEQARAVRVALTRFKAPDVSDYEEHPHGHDTTEVIPASKGTGLWTRLTPSQPSISVALETEAPSAQPVPQR